MNDNNMQFNELNDNQRRLMVNSIQTYDAWRDAATRYARYRGGMTWKTVKGKQYLYRILDRFGHAKSLGARSQETEVIYEEFVSAKAGLAFALFALMEQYLPQFPLSLAALRMFPAEIAQSIPPATR